MSDFANAKQATGLSVKLWRGERMCLVGMDVDAPEPDLVGFSIEVKSPGSADFMPLRNRLAFSYDKPVDQAVDGYRNYSSLEAPFQKFRWVHFPYDPKGGTYTYRVTKQHMPTDGTLKAGTSITLDIPLDMVIYDGFLDVGFARNFASSQAYEDKYKGNPNVIPANADDGLKFQKVPGDVYEWLGFEAYDLIMNFLKEVAADKTLTLDFFAYDLNEPGIVALLEQTGGRLRAIIDDSGAHAAATSAESQAAQRLSTSAGANNVKRMHFKNLQHNKVLIAKKNGEPIKVLFGSTNFSFRGIYIQANNALVFYAPEAAALFERAFELAFQSPAGFAKDPISTKWHLVQVPDKPLVHFCFSPHDDTLVAEPARRRHRSGDFIGVLLHRLSLSDEVGTDPGGHRSADEQNRVQLWHFRQARRARGEEARRHVRHRRLQLPSRDHANAVQGRVVRRRGHSRASQIRCHRFQLTERQGVHRLLELIAEWRGRERRQSGDGRGSSRRHLLRDRGAARVRPSAFPYRDERCLRRRQQDRCGRRRQDQAQQGSRLCAADPGHSYPAEQSRRRGCADPEKANRDQRQARLVH
jgi:hypothetical protein